MYPEFAAAATVEAHPEAGCAQHAAPGLYLCFAKSSHCAFETEDFYCGHLLHDGHEAFAGLRGY